MRVGDLVMLIGREDDMPPLGVVGEIVGPLDRGDFDVIFPWHPCPVAEPSWCVPPCWLMLIPAIPLPDIMEHETHPILHIDCN